MKITINRRLKRWRKQWNIAKHQTVFEKIYSNVDGFSLSIAARAERNAMEFVYGEITFEPFAALLGLCKPNEETVFYDLGSGTGKAVIACAMLCKVKKSVGIEYFSALHDCAQNQQHVLSLVPEYYEKSQTIQFIHDDFLNASFADATLVFINATAYFGDYWSDISRHLEQIPPKALVLSSSKALNSKLFIVLETTWITMSWGAVQMFIQERLSNLD